METKNKEKLGDCRRVQRKLTNESKSRNGTKNNPGDYYIVRGMNALKNRNIDDEIVPPPRGATLHRE